mgnify:CR=1 FL=1
MKKNRKRIDPRYFLEETAIRDDLDDSLAPLQEQWQPGDVEDYRAGGVKVTYTGRGGGSSQSFRLRADECSTDPEDENYHPMCDLYKDPKSGQKYFKIFRAPLGRLDPGSEERVSTRAAMRGKKSKLGTPTHTEPLRVREVVEDSDLGDVLERRPGKNPKLDAMRAAAAKTRGTGPYSSQPEPDEQPLPDGVDLEEVKALVAIMTLDDLDELQQHISDTLTEPGAPASDWDEDNPGLDPEDAME